jgi:hypothetical protein
MAIPLVSSVEINHIPRKKLSHALGKRLIPRLHQQMKT